MPHFDIVKLALMDSMTKQGGTPMEITRMLAQRRKRCGSAGPSKSAVYRYLAAETYDKTVTETRGRPSTFGPREMAAYDSQRRKLQTQARNEYVVTWEDIAGSGQKELRKRKLLPKGEKGLAAESLRKRMRKELNVDKRPSTFRPKARRII